MAVIVKLSVLITITVLLLCLKASAEEACPTKAKASDKNCLVDDISLNELEQDDPVLVEAVKKLIIPPANANVPYKFTT